MINKQTKRHQLIHDLRRALHELESPSFDDDVEIDILSLENFTLSQDFLNEEAD